MAIGRFGRPPRRPIGICLKMTAVAVLGLCFIVFWSMLSTSSSTLTSQRSSFSDISEPVASGTKLSDSRSVRKEHGKVDNKVKKKEKEHEVKKHGKNTKKPSNGEKDHIKKSDEMAKEKSESKIENKGGEEEEKDELNGHDDGVDKEAEEDDDEVVTDVEAPMEKEEIDQESETKGKLKKKIGPIFDPGARYIWKQCTTRSKHNYMPCIDFETSSGKIPTYRHHERSCPKAPPMCLVPLPQEGYEFPVPWPASKHKVYLKIKFDWLRHHLFCR